MSLQETSIIYNDSSYRHFYLCHYLPLSAGVDPLSRSLLKFKRGIQPDLDAWIENTLEVFHNIPLSPDTIIIRALRHDETQVRQSPSSSVPSSSLPHSSVAPSSSPPSSVPLSSSPPSSLDLLGQALATRFQCHYLPSLLCKSRPTLSNKGLTRDQREAQLNDVYSIAHETLPQATDPKPAPTPPLPASGTPAHPPFLLIDDILTTGATIRTIIHTLTQAFPLSPLQIFTLARVSHDPSGPPFHVLS